jgi:hypothetical protein
MIVSKWRLTISPDTLTNSQIYGIIHLENSERKLPKHKRDSSGQAVISFFMRSNSVKMTPLIVNGDHYSIVNGDHY